MLSRSKNLLKASYPLYLGGRALVTEHVLSVKDKYTQEVFATVSAGDAATATKAFDLAHASVEKVFGLGFLWVVPSSQRNVRLPAFRPTSARGHCCTLQSRLASARMSLHTPSSVRLERSAGGVLDGNLFAVLVDGCGFALRVASHRPLRTLRRKWGGPSTPLLAQQRKASVAVERPALLTLGAHCSFKDAIASELLLTLNAYLSARNAGYSQIVQRFPIGVVSAITPFNFPLNLVAHKVLRSSFPIGAISTLVVLVLSLAP
jgi:hypothetical protein